MHDVAKDKQAAAVCYNTKMLQTKIGSLKPKNRAIAAKNMGMTDSSVKCEILLAALRADPENRLCLGRTVLRMM